MPRGPSSRTLKNRVDIYPNISGPDAGGGVNFTYSTIPAFRQVPCTVQYDQVMEAVLEQGRVSQVAVYDIWFAIQQGLSPRDKLIWVDSLGVTRTLFVQIDNADEAGRGAAFYVKAIEEL